MIIKSFTADNSSNAIKMVRAELGADAIVLKTRQIPFGEHKGQIEITACLENATAGQASLALPDDPADLNTIAEQEELVAMSKQVQTASQRPETVEPNPSLPAAIEARLHERLAAMDDRLSLIAEGILAAPKPVNSASQVDEVRAQLLDNDVPVNFVDELLSQVDSDDSQSERVEKATALLSRSLESCIGGELKLQPGDTVVVVGPAGSGKSSIIGKLAARIVSQKQMKVRLATLDNYKIAASEEISRYADVLDVAYTDLQFDNKNKFANTDEVKLVDTPALPSDKDRRSALAGKIRALAPTHCIVVMSALTRSADIADLVDQLNDMGPTHLVVTMLDLTRRHGALITAPKTLNVKLTYTTSAPGGIGLLSVPKAGKIANQLLGIGETNE